MVRLKPSTGSMVMVTIFSGVRMRDLLDVHAALGGGDDGDPPRAAIHQHRQVIFLGDVDPVGHVNAVDLLAGFAGLHRHQRVAEHLASAGPDILDRLGNPHAALGVRPQLLELALAAPARVNLRLDDIDRAGELGGARECFLDAERRIAGRDADAELSEQLLALIFMDVHVAAPVGGSSAARRAAPFGGGISTSRAD